MEEAVLETVDTPLLDRLLRRRGVILHRRLVPLFQEIILLLCLHLHLLLLQVLAFKSLRMRDLTSLGDL